MKQLKWEFTQVFGHAPLKPGSPVEREGRTMYVKHDQFRMYKKAYLRMHGA